MKRSERVSKGVEQLAWLLHSATCRPLLLAGVTTPHKKLESLHLRATDVDSFFVLRATWQRFHVFEVTGWPVLGRHKREIELETREPLLGRIFQKKFFRLYENRLQNFSKHEPAGRKEEEEKKIIDRGKERSECFLIVILRSKHDHLRSVQLNESVPSDFHATEAGD